MFFSFFFTFYTFHPLHQLSNSPGFNLLLSHHIRYSEQMASSNRSMFTSEQELNLLVSVYFRKKQYFSCLFICYRFFNLFWVIFFSLMIVLYIFSCFLFSVWVYLYTCFSKQKRGYVIFLILMYKLTTIYFFIW